MSYYFLYIITHLVILLDGLQIKYGLSLQLI